MGSKVEYKQNLKGVGDDSADVDVVDVKVPLGYKRTIQHLSVEDETSGCTQFRVGYNRNGTLHWWMEQESPQAGVLYWMNDTKILQGGDILTVRFEDTENDDVLAVYVDGFTEKVAE